MAFVLIGLGNMKKKAFYRYEAYLDLEKCPKQPIFVCIFTWKSILVLVSLRNKRFPRFEKKCFLESYQTY